MIAAGVGSADIAAQFNEMTELLEIEGANPFRIRAYRRAAATDRGLARKHYQDARGRAQAQRAAGNRRRPRRQDQGDLRDRASCGARGGRGAIAVSPGRSTAIPGLGPKRVELLHNKLGITSIEELTKAAGAGKLRDLLRFGAALKPKSSRRLARAKSPRNSASRSTRPRTLPVPSRRISARDRACAGRSSPAASGAARNRRRSRYPGDMRRRGGGDGPFRTI